jgi:hypothetical protein
LKVLADGAVYRKPESKAADDVQRQEGADVPVVLNARHHEERDRLVGHVGRR